MGILLNGWSTSRSSSPVMMQEAFAATATSSRNLSSFGSRQAVMEMFGSTLKLASNKLFKNTERSEGLGKYLSNFSLPSTDSGSSMISSAINIRSSCMALKKAPPLTEFGSIAALMRLLVSNTNSLIILGQYFLKDFFGKSVLFGGPGYFSHGFYKFFLFPAQHFFSQTEIHNLRNVLFAFTRYRAPLFGCIRRDFNTNSFHSIYSFEYLKIKRSVIRIQDFLKNFLGRPIHLRFITDTFEQCVETHYFTLPFKRSFKRGTQLWREVLPFFCDFRIDINQNPFQGLTIFIVKTRKITIGLAIKKDLSGLVIPINPHRLSLLRLSEHGNLTGLILKQTPC